MGKEYLIQGDPFPSFLDQITLFIDNYHHLIWLGFFVVIFVYWKKDAFQSWLISLTPPKKRS